MSIDKTLTVAVNVPITVRWILASTEPSAQPGYSRLPEFDMSLGDFGTLWAFKKD